LSTRKGDILEWHEDKAQGPELTAVNDASMERAWGASEGRA
jgi:hypothetical protein